MRGLTKLEESYLAILQQIAWSGEGMHKRQDWNTDKHNTLSALGFVDKTVKIIPTSTGNKEATWYTITPDGQALIEEFQRVKEGAGTISDHPHLIKFWQVIAPDRLGHFLMEGILSGGFSDAVAVTPQPQFPQYTALKLVTSFFESQFMGDKVTALPSDASTLTEKGRHIGGLLTAFDIENALYIAKFLEEQGVQNGDTQVLKFALALSFYFIRMIQQ